MLSRVADHLFWMSRYMERAENLARLLQVSLELLLDAERLGDSSLKRYWHPVLAAISADELYHELHPDSQGVDIAHFLSLDERNPHSILSCVIQARENARTVRDQISDEMWAGLNDLFLYVGSDEAAEQVSRSPQTFYERVIQAVLLFHGVTAATLPRDEGWHFLRLGRFLERADKTSRFLDIKSFRDDEGDEAQESIQWASILRSCSAFSVYRRLYGGEASTRNVIDLLVFSTEFPRSVRYCIREVNQSLHDISGIAQDRYSNKAEKVTGQLLADLNYSDPDDVLRVGLHEYIDDLQIKLNAAALGVFETYVYLPREMNRLAVRSQAAENRRFLEQEQQQQQ